jgi:hypothetical protein
MLGINDMGIVVEIERSMVGRDWPCACLVR